MRIFGRGLFVATIIWGFASGCATGGAADDVTPNDSGLGKPDTSTTHDSGGPKDSGVTPKDSSVTQDTGGGNCGGQCLGNASTCCSNTCVDITSDPNNCGGCNNPCGSESCCSGNCVDTMGTDVNNCGGCGTVCAGTCTNGQCQTNNGNCTLDMGSCSHSPCTTGGALSPSCDSNDEDIVTFICFLDISCCITAWDATCVSDAQSFELNSCQGGGC